MGEGSLDRCTPGGTGVPVDPERDRSTESSTVSLSFPSGVKTEIVWVYIMFWAVTRPVGEATTDLGLRFPVIRSRRTKAV